MSRQTSPLAAIGLAIAGAACTAKAAAGEPANGDRCAVFDHTHGAWTAMLRRYVVDGLVDYQRLGQEATAGLNGYLAQLRSTCRAGQARWSREQRLAFWINAYNAYAVRLVLDHYPVTSIRSIGLLPLAAFRDRFIPLGGPEGSRMSLNEIENDILRGQFKEPRIHFAIVCASRGCPKLGPEAYRAQDLGRQLDEAAAAFLADPEKNRLDPASGVVRLSPIFEWYRGDFEEDARSLSEFAIRYAPPDLAAALKKPGVRIEFNDYDWSLNGR